MTYTTAVCRVRNSWWWTEELSETCRVLFQKWIWEISASGWFHYKNLSRCAVTWTSNSATDWLIVLECLSPLSKKQATCRKNPRNNIRRTNERPTQLSTVLKQNNSIRIRKRGMSDLYPCSTWQAQVRRAFRDFNHQTPPNSRAFRTEYRTLPSLSIFKPANGQTTSFIFSFSWLPSPSLELRTLAGYCALHMYWPHGFTV